MKKKKITKSRLDDIKAAIVQAAEVNSIHPQQVTKLQIFEADSSLNEWDLRVAGGIASIKKTFPMSAKDLSTIRSISAMNRYVAKLERDLGDKLRFEEKVLDEIKNAIQSIKFEKVKIPKPKKGKHNKKMTMELMLSDIHIGKKTPNFNFDICRQRLQKLTSTFLQEIEDNNKLFNVERIILAVLGDIIESFTMHGLESAAACEFGNAKQIEVAIKALFHDVILPIAKTGLKIDIPAVTGNHDRTENKRTFNDPGQSNMTWVIYKTLEEICRISGLKNVKFYIPKDSYVILPIYKNHCLYEHGDNNPNRKNAFEEQISKRSKQEKVVIDFGRFGHYHEYQCYGRGRIIVNESVCGIDSFAKVHGFDTTAGQTINYYIETKERPTCFYKSFPVFLG
jgi:predicted phosphodiesterase